MKKVITLLLTAVICSSPLPLTALAATYNLTNDITWSLTTLDGQTITHDTYQGKTLLLMFYWGAYCGIASNNVKAVCESDLIDDDRIVVIAIAAGRQGDGDPYSANALENILSFKGGAASHCDNIIFTYDYDNRGSQLMWDYARKTMGSGGLQAGTFNVIIDSNNTIRFAWQNNRNIFQEYFMELGIVADSTITTIASNGGSAIGSGNFKAGETVILKAIPNPGYTFEGWYEENAKVSSNATYTFTTSASSTLLALFTPIPAQDLNIMGTVKTTLIADDVNVGIKLSWTPAEEAKGYRIYRSTTKGEKGGVICEDLSGTDFVDINIDPDTTYYYSIYKLVEDEDGNLAEKELLFETEETTGEDIVEKDKEHLRSYILMKVGKESMLVNDKEVEIDPGRDTAPMILNGRTVMPIRAVIEAMGGEVGWDESSQAVYLNVNDNKIEMVIDSYDFTVNGSQRSLDVPPQVINGRTMLPVRFVTENIGCLIEWIGSTQEIVIVF